MRAMRAEILTIGSEILNGTTVDTNSAYLARRLNELGIACQKRVSVPDDPILLQEAFRLALQSSDLLLVTGGLGPTLDDITIEMLAESLNKPLVRDAAVEQRVRTFYRRRNRKLTHDALRQALLPEGSQPLFNSLGTAPGVWLSLPRTLVVALPGVPGEMKAIFEDEVLPRLRQIPERPAIESITLRTAGIVELQIEHALRKIGIPKEVSVGLYPQLKTVDVRISCTAPTPEEAQKCIRPLVDKLAQRLGDAVYGTGEDKIEAVIGKLLQAEGWTLALAESCTGGQASDRLTLIPGSSRYFLGGVVAYSNSVKQRLLGVPAKILAHDGAVSPTTARMMAQGVRRATGASIGFGITGIAGPTGGSKRKPVGLVYFGLSDETGSRSFRYQFFGDRDGIKAQATQTALNLIRLHLLRAKGRLSAVGSCERKVAQHAVRRSRRA